MIICGLLAAELALKLDHKKAVRSFVNGGDVFESLTTNSGKFECQ